MAKYQRREYYSELADWEKDMKTNIPNSVKIHINTFRKYYWSVWNGKPLKPVPFTNQKRTQDPRRLHSSPS